MNESQKPKAVDWSARIGLSTAIYSVSAAFVLFGIYRLSKGTLNGTLVLPKCLCLGSLSLYETAMLASVCLLVLGRALKDEAVCAMPILKSFEVSASNDGGFGFDANMLSCYAPRLDNSSHYVWNPKVSGGKWADWNNPNSALIWDASPHRVNSKINAVFGDGHVEEISVEKMQEMMR